MLTKTLLVLAIAVLAVQGKNVKPASAKSVQPRDLYDEAQSRLGQLKQVADEAIEMNLGEISLLPRELAALGAAAVVPAETEIQVLYNHLLNQVERTKEQFGQQGIDLTECINLYKYEIDILPRTVLNQIIRCVDESVDLGLELIDRAIIQMRNAGSVISRFTLQLEECRILTNDEACLARVIERIDLEIINLPATVREDADRTRSVVRALETQFHACSYDRLDEVEYVGNALLSYIITCGTSGTLKKE